MRYPALLVLVALLTVVRPAAGQNGLSPDVARRVTAVLNDAGTDRRTGDVRVRAGQTVPGGLAVVDGDLVLGGRVEGDVIVLNGGLELEPGAHVTGRVIVMGGDVQGAEGATVGGDIVAYAEPVAYCQVGERMDLDPDGCRAAPAPVAAVEVDEPRNDDGVGIVTGADDRWEPDTADDRGRASLVVAAGRSYNRVEGLPIRVGPSLETAGRNPTRLRALAIFRTEEGPELGPERWGYDARLEQFFGGRESMRVGGRLYSVIEPIEGWHLTDVENSLATFFLHRDYRDHYEREGWSAYATWAPPKSPVSATLEYRQERHRPVAAGSPWALFNNAEPWRAQPLVGRGTLEAVGALVELDTRSEQWDPSSGWYVRAEVEQALNARLSRPEGLAPTGDPAPVLPRLPFRDEWVAGTLDVRRYNRISPTSRLNLRVAAGGSLNGRPLPPQRQHALGGEGSMPGFGLFELDCGARTGQVRRGAEPDAPLWFPEYGCEGVALLQAEWRGDLSFGFRLGDWIRGGRRDEPGDDEGEEDEDDGGGWSQSDFSTLGGDFGWVFFADLAAGWGGRQGDEDTAADVGAGITFGNFGFYAAVPVFEDGGRGGLNLFIRLAPRF